MDDNMDDNITEEGGLKRSFLFFLKTSHTREIFSFELLTALHAKVEIRKCSVQLPSWVVLYLKNINSTFQ